MSDAWKPSGLSPRLRGNRAGAGPQELPLRSIPAPAGEPYLKAAVIRLSKVYPRACGGTAVNMHRRQHCIGLSPRLRGNRGEMPDIVLPDRSIPAPAGEPASALPRTALSPVYPRACGGTDVIREFQPDVSGLSPRLRGNLCKRAG